MEYKFDVGVDVTILGTDKELGVVFGTVNFCDPDIHTEWYLIKLDNPEAVYPYRDDFRIYPEWMLESL
mgnify:CR=1 FL=1